MPEPMNTIELILGPAPRVLSPNRRGHWAEWELKLLKRWYGSHEGRPLELRQLGIILQRDHHNVCRKARRLGLTKQSRPKPWRCRDGPRRKYATTEEANAAIGRATKTRIAQNGHPRGMLGKHHSERTKWCQGAMAREQNSRRTPGQVKTMADKAIETKLARYGSAGSNCRGLGVGPRPYSRCRGGKRPDIGDMYFRSAWEANYARYLAWLVEMKQIRGWKYEADTFRFGKITRGTITYTPDFRVENMDGSVEYHEVKGWMDAKSKTRLRRMKKYHPGVGLRVIGQVEYKTIAKQVSAFVPCWE